MATIDKLLIALAAKEMDCLVLEPGRRPCLRRNGVDHEVTKTPLDPKVITRLLTEVAPPGESPGDRDESRWEFDYATDRKVFKFFGLRGPRGWLVSVTYDPDAVAPEPPPEPEPPPRPAAPPAAPGPAAAPGGAAAPAAEGFEPQPITDVGALLTEVVGRGASDLHLSASQPPYVRVDGRLEPLKSCLPPNPERLEELLTDVLPDGNRDELAAGHHTGFAFELEGRGRFRVHVCRERRGLVAAFRLIPQKIFSLEELGLPEAAHPLTGLRRGLVLVTGTSGSGKSTTLAALVDRINRERSGHLVTIEDPIELEHSSRRCLVHQRQVGRHADSAAQALTAALREDPDVLVIGDLRDPETIALALAAAESGPLVLATLPTPSAAATVARIVDPYTPERKPEIHRLLAASLKAVISQTLLRRIGGGRVAAFELLLVSPAIAGKIRRGETGGIEEAIEAGRGLGMRRLDESLAMLVEDGLVATDEALRQAYDKAALTRRLRASETAATAPGTQPRGAG